MQPESQDATEVWATALRELWQAAGEPTGKALIRQAAAQRPRVKMTAQSWSDWRNGKNVPSEQRTALWLVAHLRAQASRTSPTFEGKPDAWWQKMWQQARAERA
ncbi:hypothetical protein ACFQ07_04570, partial [Actinomadura adrarensis]